MHLNVENRLSSVAYYGFVKDGRSTLLLTFELARPA